MINISEIFLKTSLTAEAFAVDTAEDGEKGSRLARTNDYDLIVLDNMLPKKNGLEVCKEVRADGKAVPILMLSVMSGSETKVELLNAGADDYLIKPFKKFGLGVSYKLVSDKVEAVHYADTGEDVDPQHYGDFNTIEEMFMFVEKALEKNPADLSIAYNEEYGYIKELSVDFKENIADDEISIIASNMRPR